MEEKGRTRKRTESMSIDSEVSRLWRFVSSRTSIEPIQDLRHLDRSARNDIFLLSSHLRHRSQEQEEHSSEQEADG